MSTRSHATPLSTEAAGVKLLAFAMQRNILKVRSRYKNCPEVVSVCYQVWALTESMLECAERGSGFQITVTWQPPLPSFSDSDIAYGEGYPE